VPNYYYVAWWNLENLFDEENSPRRTEKVARVIKNDIAGWTPALRDRKIAQLATVIAQMNGGTGPDLVGAENSSRPLTWPFVCEPDRVARVVSTRSGVALQTLNTLNFSTSSLAIYPTPPRSQARLSNGTPHA
jgi:hypothetical protein